MESFLSLIDKVSEWSGKAFSFLIMLATLLITAEVIMRYALNNPTIWSLQLTIYVCGITYVMGGAYALRYDAHIRVDVLYNQWSPRLKAIMDLVTSPLLYFGVGTMLWIGAEWTIEAYLHGETSGGMWSPLIWPIRVFIPLGSLLLILQAIAKSIRDFGKAKKGVSA
jgi:TRAP-type mannitol/chloroaromatic compound transport system permease small subunit